jgi:hypothetical protein
MKFKYLNAVLVSLILTTSFVGKLANAGLIDTGLMTINNVVDSSSSSFNFNTGNGELIDLSYLWVSIGACSTSFDSNLSCNEANNSYQNEISLSLTNNTYGITASLIPTNYFSSGIVSFEASFSLSTAFTEILPITLQGVTSPAQYNSTNMGLFDGQGFGDSSWTLTFSDSAGGDPKILRAARFTANTVSVPEPSTIAILALGLIGLASRRFKI